MDLEHGELIESTVTRLKCNSNESAHFILQTWKSCILKCKENHNLDAISIAMPGPFMYDQGISLMHGLGKFDSLFGVNIRQYFSSEFNLPGSNIKFLNDAACFALGEYHFGSAKGYRKGIYLTIGSGFGSTFLDDGLVVSTGDFVPKHGWLYHVPFKTGIAEDYFSDKWILKRYHELSGGEEFFEVKDIPENSLLETIFNELSENLSKFLENWLLKFEATCLIIGGSIFRYKSHLMLPTIKNSFKSMNLKVDVKAAELFENGALLGASAIFKDNLETKNDLFRQTDQPVLPILKEKKLDYKYDMYPTFECDDEFKINFGYDSLVLEIIEKKCIIIDGYVGTMFNHIREEIDKRLKEKNKKVLWVESTSALKLEEELEAMVQPFLGCNDPLFGKRCNLDIREFFNKDCFQRFKKDENFDINILIGVGSSLAGWDAPLFYFDVPKNEIQYRSRAKSISNFGLKNENSLSAKQAYKRFYFVDWPVLNSYKNEIKEKIEVYVDDQRYKNPIWTKGDHLRNALTKLSSSVIRVRPWFEPGVWGGNWMKQNIPNIEQNTKNYAWSFELIAPENGIILSKNSYMLEVPFDFFMYLNQNEILGKKGAEMFKYDFPIRFDFLDTFDGDNLSIQCHPGRNYMEKNFNETLPQDETYYILDAKEDAQVYLGFQKDINEGEFRSEVEKSFHNSEKLDIQKYVKSHSCKVHDFFLIPHGTIHGSGKNNLVLEISSTPYIFTFKIYDWVRADLDGKPRTLNIKRGFENLDFSRQGDLVEKELICSGNVLIENGTDWNIYHLKTHEVQFYDVHRIEFLSDVKIETNDQFHILMLVEGDFIFVETENNHNQRLHYSETFLIPAAAKTYRLINGTRKICKVIKAFVKK